MCFHPVEKRRASWTCRGIIIPRTVMSLEILTEEAGIFGDRAMTCHFGGWRSSQNNGGHVDVSNGKLTSPIQVDNDLLTLHLESNFAGWCRSLNVLADVDHQSTASVVSCAAAISVQTLCVEARDFCFLVLLTELCFLEQRQVNSAALQDVRKHVTFCSQGITIPL